MYCQHVWCPASVLRPYMDGASDFVWYEFYLRTYAREMWVENYRGFIRVEYQQTQDEMNGDREDIASTLLFRETYEHGRARCRTPVSRKDKYGKLSAFGYGFGPCFRTMSDIYYGNNGEAISIIKTQDWITKIPPSSVEKNVIYPTALDGIIHIILPGLFMGGKSIIPTLWSRQESTRCGYQTSYCIKRRVVTSRSTQNPELADFAWPNRTSLLWMPFRTKLASSSKAYK